MVCGRGTTRLSGLGIGRVTLGGVPIPASSTAGPDRTEPRRMSHDRERRPRALVAPLVPLALAVIAGVVADRFGGTCETRAWAWLALAGALVAVASRLRGAPGYAGLLV